MSNKESLNYQDMKAYQLKKEVQSLAIEIYLSSLKNGIELPIESCFNKAERLLTYYDNE